MGEAGTVAVFDVDRATMDNPVLHLNAQFTAAVAPPPTHTNWPQISGADYRILLVVYELPASGESGTPVEIFRYKTVSNAAPLVKDIPLSAPHYFKSRYAVTYGYDTLATENQFVSGSAGADDSSNQKISGDVSFSYDLDCEITSTPHVSRFYQVQTAPSYVGNCDEAQVLSFTVGGTSPKKVICEAYGPDFNLPDQLDDPTLELLDSLGRRIAFNDNWRDTQEAEIQAAGWQPPNNRDPAILRPLDPGTYFVVTRGKNGSTGVALTVASALDSAGLSSIVGSRRDVKANETGGEGATWIRTTGTQGYADNPIHVRVVGPSLGLAGALERPTLQIVDASTQEVLVSTEGELSATFEPKQAHSYRAIVQGAELTSGIAYFEASYDEFPQYELAPPTLPCVTPTATPTPTPTPTTTPSPTATPTPTATPRFSVVPSAGAGGSITPATTQTVPLTASVSFTAAPATGYVVNTWLLDGAVVQTGGSSFRLSNVKANHSVRVTFARKTFTVRPVADANGVISPATSQIVTYGDAITFTAKPASGFAVNTWLVDGAVAQHGGLSYSVRNVTAAHTVKVMFAIRTFAVSGSAGQDGTIKPAGRQTVAYGHSITFAAVPAAGFDVNAWLVDGAVVQHAGTFFTLTHVTRNHTVKVTFK